MGRRVLSCEIDPASTRCALTASIRLSLTYEAEADADEAPRWSLWYIADAVYSSTRVLLFRAEDSMKEGEREMEIKKGGSFMISRREGTERRCRFLTVCVNDFAGSLEQVPVRSLSQVGLLQICEDGGHSAEAPEGDEEVLISIVCHVRDVVATPPGGIPAPVNENLSYLMRCLYNPME
ncbi:unnamed protein product [Phytomonas sp. Hart1]|nr:unnamed protein product [Phytomonas sp. Hart1]|eukprot:CCW71042.1 unnamed protein product [Phytomonas sp. isolate Hart1]